MNADTERTATQYLDRLAQSVMRNVSSDLSATFETINWMAHCARRMHYPLDTSERSGLPAFEYGWKALNSIYGVFPSNGERNKIKECLKIYLPNASDFTLASIDKMQLICHSLLSSEFNVLNAPPHVERAISRIRHLASQLQNAMDTKDDVSAPDLLAMVLYELRNARVHGDPYLGGSAVVEHGSVETGIVRIPTTYRAIPPAILELCIWLMSNKIRKDRSVVKLLVDEFVQFQLWEIKATVCTDWKTVEVSDCS